MDEYRYLFDAVAGGDPEILLLSLAALLIFPAVCFFVMAGCAGYLTTILSIASCAYPVARAKAAGTPYLREEKIDELLDAGMAADALSRLQEAGYISSLSPGSDKENFGFLLEEHERKEFQTLLLSIPPDFQVFFAQYQRIHEIRQIKRMLRMLHHHTAADEMIEAIRPAGSVTGDLISRIATSSDFEEGIHQFRGTGYEFLEGEPLTLFRQHNSILPLEIALDRFGSEEIIKAASLVRTQLAAPFRDLVSMLTDVQNIRILIRAKHAGLPPSFITSCLLDGGMRIPAWRLVQLNEMMSVPDLVSQLAGTGYDRVLHPLLSTYPGPESLAGFDLALDRFVLAYLVRISQVYYYTGGPLIWFMLAKELEYRNIQVVLTGLQEGISPDQIKRYLVFEQVAG